MTAAEFQQRLIRTLVAEIEADLGSVSDLAGVIAVLADRARREDDGVVLAALALRMEHFYTAIETILLRIAKVVDGVVPEGETWHQQLLKQMSLEIPEVRPACLSSETLELLRPLLGFRHFLRHAYAVRLDRTKLLARAGEVALAATGAPRDLRAFVEFLRRVSSMGQG